MAAAGLPKSIAFALVIAATVVFTAGELLSSVTGMVIITEASPPDQLGNYVGVSQMFTGLAITLCPFVYTSGLSASAGGFWGVLIVVCVGMIVASKWLRAPLAQRSAQNQPADT
jgi:hypothetical protein